MPTKITKEKVPPDQSTNQSANQSTKRAKEKIRATFDPAISGEGGQHAAHREAADEAMQIQDSVLRSKRLDRNFTRNTNQNTKKSKK